MIMEHPERANNSHFAGSSCEEDLKMDNTPVVSVIVPVYRVESFLSQCVDSILNQTFPDFELILVDDGSPDNCGSICEDYASKDSRVRVVHQKNGGLSAARNAGIDIARGRFLSFVDSDDAVSPHYLERLVAVAAETDATIVTGQFSIHADALSSGTEPARLLNGAEACLEVYHGQKTVKISAWCKLYRRSLFDCHRFPVGKIHEDQFLIPLLLYESIRVAAIPDLLYFYRIHSASISHGTFSKKRFDNIEGLDLCIDYFRNKNEEEIVQAAKRSRQILLSAYNLQAYNANVTIPEQYRIDRHDAISFMRKLSPEENNTFYRSLAHPVKTRLTEYWIKIKKMLRIPSN